MNAKKAKALRREAREQTQGSVERDYRATEVGMVTLSPGCTHAVYQGLKRAGRHAHPVAKLPKARKRSWSVAQRDRRAAIEASRVFSEAA